MTETDGEILERMGTDATKWTDQFMEIADGLMVIDGGADGLPGEPSPNVNWGTMIGWFANAIEAGRSAGFQEGLRDRTEWA